MAILGIVAGTIGLAAGVRHHTLNRSWSMVAMLVFVPPVAVCLACLPTLAVSIRIEEGKVKHLLLDRYVLAAFPVADFTSMELWRRPWGAVIHFKGGQRIRFIGAHLGILTELQNVLEQGKNGANQAPEDTARKLADLQR